MGFLSACFGITELEQVRDTQQTSEFQLVGTSTKPQRDVQHESPQEVTLLAAEDKDCNLAHKGNVSRGLMIAASHCEPVVPHDPGDATTSPLPVAKHIRHDVAATATTSSELVIVEERSVVVLVWQSATTNAASATATAEHGSNAATDWIALVKGASVLHAPAELREIVGAHNAQVPQRWCACVVLKSIWLYEC
jgi:hypothetical protein